MRYRCKDCDVVWWPYMAKHGCPECGSGVVRTWDPPDPNVSTRYFEAARRNDERAVEDKRRVAIERFDASCDFEAAVKADLDRLLISPYTRLQSERRGTP
jgi:predicted  nucleic acid-binding Zn-ribbon protein